MGSGHGHGHGHGHGVAVSRQARPRRALTLALGLTLGFVAVEFVVGLWSGSLALLADAGHMLGDSVALLLSLIFAIIAERPPSSAKTYGYRRAEVLGALLNALALCLITVWISFEAVQRIGHAPAVHGSSMLAAAVVGLIVNLAAAFVLMRFGGQGLNVRSALLHVLGDALGSVSAIVAGILLVGWDLRVADPVASLIIAALLLYGGVRLLNETTHVLMEGAPRGLDVAELERVIRGIEGVGSVHDLHVWSLTPGAPMLTAHVVLEPGSHGTVVTQAVGRRLREHGIEHVTVQAEAPSPGLVALRRKGEDGGSGDLEDPGESLSDANATGDGRTPSREDQGPAETESA